MKIEIRQAEKEDMKYVLELIKELAIFERAFSPTKIYLTSLFASLKYSRLFTASE